MALSLEFSIQNLTQNECFAEAFGIFELLEEILRQM